MVRQIEDFRFRIQGGVSLSTTIDFESDRSKAANGGPITEFRPAVPNRLVTGAAKAQGLNQAAGVRVSSAARPPAETVAWQAGSGLTNIGPAVYGSAIASGRSNTPKSALVALCGMERFTVKGRPDWIVRIPPTCQSASKAFKPFAFPSTFGKGSSTTSLRLNRCDA